MSSTIEADFGKQVQIAEVVIGTNAEVVVRLKGPYIKDNCGVVVSPADAANDLGFSFEAKGMSAKSVCWVD